MPKLVSVFIDGRLGRLARAVLSTVLFLALVGAGAVLVLWQIEGLAARKRADELGRIMKVHDTAVSALARLEKEATAPPCSPEFLEKMQQVAFLPDGLNEFFYAPQGVVACGTSRLRLDQPPSFGDPDIQTDGPDGPRLWINRDLSMIGHRGVSTTIIALRTFAVVIPPYEQPDAPSSWLTNEVVAIDAKGGNWSIGGEEGVYLGAAASEPASLASRVMKLGGVTCDDEGPYCVASSVSPLAWAREWTIIPVTILLLAALLAPFGASRITAWLARYWSFETRFSRDLENVVLAYQPIVDMRSGQVTGCEVLSRWRDFDGTIVPADRFIAFVERTGRTTEFTRIVVDRAYRELSEHVSPDVKLQVNFNVFGCDFNGPTLIPIFADFLKLKDRLAPAVELVETQDVQFESAQNAMLELKRAGLKVYIDDFGIGYSSIERVATLAVDGVKLDRSFAMAHPDSVLGRILIQVLDMLKMTGRSVVVEGVETLERLELLRSTDSVDFVQGFVISRPLAIEDFVVFLKHYRVPISLSRARDSAPV